MWKKIYKKIKSELISKKKTIIKSGNYEYPITYQLIKDGRKNKVLKKKLIQILKLQCFTEKKMK